MSQFNIGRSDGNYEHSNRRNTNKHMKGAVLLHPTCHPKDMSHKMLETMFNETFKEKFKDMLKQTNAQ